MLLYNNNDKLFFYLFGGYFMYVQYAEASTCICTYVQIVKIYKYIYSVCVFWIPLDYDRIQ